MCNPVLRQFQVSVCTEQRGVTWPNDHCMVHRDLQHNSGDHDWTNYSWIVVISCWNFSLMLRAPVWPNCVANYGASRPSTVDTKQLPWWALVMWAFRVGDSQPCSLECHVQILEPESDCHKTSIGICIVCIITLIFRKVNVAPKLWHSKWAIRGFQKQHLRVMRCPPTRHLCFFVLHFDARALSKLIFGTLFCCSHIYQWL